MRKYHKKRDGTFVLISDMQKQHIKWIMDSIIKKSGEGIFVDGRALVGCEALEELNFYAYQEEYSKRRSRGGGVYTVYDLQGVVQMTADIKTIAEVFNYDVKSVSNSIYLETPLDDHLCIVPEGTDRTVDIEEMCRNMDRRYVYEEGYGNPRYTTRKPYSVSCMARDARQKYTEAQLIEAEEHYKRRNSDYHV